MYSFYYQRKLSLPCSQERMDLFVVLEGLARRWELGRVSRWTAAIG